MSKNQISKEQVELFRSLFRGRSDAFGADSGRCIKEPLTDEIIQEHLTGKRRIGVYPLCQEILDAKGTWWSVIDFDDNNLNLTIQLRDILISFGLDCYIEKSKSKGFHVWTFFAEPIPSKKTRAVMKYALTMLEGDTGYNVKEIFPKQDSLNDKDSYGNYLNMPLFDKDVANGRTVFLDPDSSFEPYQDQWDFLQSIKKVTPQQIDDLIAQTEIKLAEEPPAKEKDSQSSFSWQIMNPCFQEMIEGVNKGSRNTVAFVLAKHLRMKDFPQNATMAILQNVWNPNNVPPMESIEITKIVEDVYQGRKGIGYSGLGCESIKQFCGKEKCIVYRKYWGQLETPSTRYFDNGVFIPKLLGDELMSEHSFLNDGQQIYLYENGVYRPTGEICIKQKCRAKLSKHARIIHIKEVVEHVKDSTFIEMEKLNTHEDMINLSNVVLNWRTMETLPHSESYLSTIRIPVEYDPKAECPQIDRFMEEILPLDCIPLVLEIIGYCLIPDKRARYSLVYLFYGGGSNGKSTLVNLIQELVGHDNISNVPLQELDSNRFKRADLVSKLINSYSDVSGKPLESSSYLKTITGGDKIDIERKNKDPQYVTITAKLLYSCNFIPISPNDRSWGFYRRLCIIPFPNQFSGSDSDKNLIDKITQPKELSGLLNKALIALKRLFDNGGFTEAESSKKLLEQYKNMNDPTAAFVTGYCNTDDLNARTERSELYKCYSVYCKNSGYAREGRNDFYERIRNYPGLTEVEGGQGEYYFVGIVPKTK